MPDTADLYGPLYSLDGLVVIPLVVIVAMIVSLVIIAWQARR